MTNGCELAQQPELEQLLADKGRLSRLIGEAKKSRSDFSALLAEMKTVSARISALKEQSQTVAAPVVEAPAAITAPALFRKSYVEVGAVVQGIRVSLAEAPDIGAQWNAFVAQQDAASIYHQWAFRAIVMQAFGHRCPYFVAKDAEDRICGVLPLVELKSRLFGHFWVSLPFFTYGGVLARDAAVVRALYAAAEEAAHTCGATHIEYRDTTCVPGDSAPVKTGKISMVRELPGTAEQLWDDIGTKVRAQIKKADKFELTIRFGKAELVDDFYRVFAENMRDLGTPVYAKRFFDVMMASPLVDRFDIAVVYHRGKPIGSCFLMHYRDIMEIPWASTLRRSNDMNTNMFMYWQVLSFAISKGVSFFDFGRSSRDSTTWRFKKQWGAQEKDLYWRYWLPGGAQLPELNPSNPKYQLMIKTWQCLPVWLTKLIGPPVVKFLP